MIIMKRYNPTRYSSAVGEAWMHTSFKTKFTHKIFDIKEVREYCLNLFKEAFNRYKIECRKIGFDSNHVHMMIDIANYSRPQIAKMLKGYTAKKLLQKFPLIKKKYFWGSGLWSPAYYMYSVGHNMNFMENYIMKQKYSLDNIVQIKLDSFVHATGL